MIPRRGVGLGGKGPKQGGSKDHLSLDLARAGFRPLLAVQVQSSKLCSHTEYPSHPYPVPGEKVVSPMGRLREKAPREGLAHNVAYSGTSQIWELPQEGFNKKEGLN